MAAEEDQDAGVEESFEELAKRAESAEDDDDDDVIIEMDRGADAEALVERVTPMQANEFTCRSCFLVKHRSQLADKKRVYCRDCA